MAQQTAVEWLVNELLSIQSIKEDEITESNKAILTTSTIEKAKQMEKEQIQDAWNDGNFLGRNGNLFVDYNTKEGYYKSEFENK